MGKNANQHNLEKKKRKKKIMAPNFPNPGK